eukprot:4681848-Amphidinium_carterae.1
MENLKNGKRPFLKKIPLLTWWQVLRLCRPSWTKPSLRFAPLCKMLKASRLRTSLAAPSKPPHRSEQKAPNGPNG